MNDAVERIDERLARYDDGADSLAIVSLRVQREIAVLLAELVQEVKMLRELQRVPQYVLHQDRPGVLQPVCGYCGAQEGAPHRPECPATRHATTCGRCGSPQHRAQDCPHAG